VDGQRRKAGWAARLVEVSVSASCLGTRRVLVRDNVLRMTCAADQSRGRIAPAIRRCQVDTLVVPPGRAGPPRRDEGGVSRNRRTRVRHRGRRRSWRGTSTGVHRVRLLCSLRTMLPLPHLWEAGTVSELAQRLHGILNLLGGVPSQGPTSLARVGRVRD